jgi:cytochrome c553
MKWKLKWVVAIIIVLALGWAAERTAAGGFSARQEPSAAEAFVARGARRLAMPKAAREMQNPVPFSGDILVEARRHFADHCASCHGNDGSGNTEMGRNLYPKAPDMRMQRTQELTDGEIYFVIRNGIRLSGMPAWGKDTDDDRESWALVQFIRRLPKLSPAEIEDMQSFNPKSPAELREEQEEEDFLNGKGNGNVEESSHHH